MFQYFAREYNWSKDVVMKMTRRDIMRYQTEIGKFLTSLGSRRIESEDKEVIFDAQRQMQARRNLIVDTIKARLE